MKAVASLHPIVLFVYFIEVLLVAMLTLNPIAIAGACAGSVFLFSIMNKREEVLRNICFYFFLFLLIGITNPLFSHNGVTPLFFMNDNPITLEAVLYGCAAAGMLISVMFWCKCYSQLMTSDKFLYLFGKAIPKMSLILSMALRFIPEMKKQMRAIRNTQRTIGLYTSDSMFDRLRGEVRVFSALLTWSLENAVDTSDAMRARGYGLKGRSNFSLFVFRKRDGILLGIFTALFVVIIFGIQQRLLLMNYYPAVTAVPHTLPSVGIYLLLFLLMLFPFFMELEGEIYWKYLRSKM